MRKLSPLFLALISLISILSSAQQIKLIPEPKEIKPGGKPFVITAATRIVLSRAHVKEDRVAAEMLADEIESARGKRLQIATELPATATNAIVLTRLSDQATTRRLERAGL